MAIYHEVWLKAHPERSTEWLEAVLADGFDIHHVDGDHSNNASDNLILLEHSDHLRVLHLTAPLRIQRPGAHGERLVDWNEKFKAKGAVAYDMRAQGKTWPAIAIELGLVAANLSEAAAAGRIINLAKSYARTRGLLWPVHRS